MQINRLSLLSTPPAAAQLLEAAKIKKGSGEPNRSKVASVTWDQIRTIAEDKVDLNAFTVESAMKMIAGTARSMGKMLKVNHLKIIIMAKLTKNRKESISKFDRDMLYSLEEASKIVKDFPQT